MIFALVAAEFKLEVAIAMTNEPISSNEFHDAQSHTEQIGRQ
jgi:hypothetical protein